MVTEKEAEVKKIEEEVNKNESTAIKLKVAVEYIYCM